MKKTFVGFSVIITVICTLLVILIATGLWDIIFLPKDEEQIITKIIMPGDAGSFWDSNPVEQTTRGESQKTRVPIDEGEVVISVITRDSEDGTAEEQFAVFRNKNDSGQVFITCIIYDETLNGYRRAWTAPTAAVRPETISMFSKDIIGDRNNCIVVTGMNDRYEHTMTIFKHNPRLPLEQAYKKIAEIQIDGSIVIQETGRSYAYQQGISRGQSFTIAAYGQDKSSNNILDQIETIFSYNPLNEQYEKFNVSRIPGSQIEQRKIRELLSGAPGVFENFINDLWYYVSPQGTLDSRQYLYFNPSVKEIIFFIDETQQVFRWEGSTISRFGLCITSQNISISTMRRIIDVQLESLDSIKLWVRQDLHLKITVGESWDGTYRRAGISSQNEPVSSVKPAFNALYDSSWGRFRFNNSGEYTLNSEGASTRGHYVFFKINNQELLELRPEQNAESRMVYKIDASSDTALTLSRVRLSTNGIQNLLEAPITLIPVE
jgi:hypothetical protein